MPVTGVAGGIGGVGDYINSYGNGIQASMAPSGAATAVAKAAPNKATGLQKPPAVQKALPSSASAPKALPPAGGKPKALPAPPVKAATPKPGVVAKPKPGASAAPKALNGAKPLVGQAQKTPESKTRISPESRPKPVGLCRMHELWEQAHQSRLLHIKLHSLQLRRSQSCRMERSELALRADTSQLRRQ